MELTRYVITLKVGTSKLEMLDVLGRDTFIDDGVNSNEIPDRAIEIPDGQKRLSNKRTFELDLSLIIIQMCWQLNIQCNGTSLF